MSAVLPRYQIRSDRMQFVSSNLVVEQLSIALADRYTMGERSAMMDQLGLHPLPQTLTYTDRCVIPVKIMTLFVAVDSSVADLGWFCKLCDGRREASHTLGS